MAMKIILFISIFFLIISGCEKDIRKDIVPAQIYIVEPCATMVDSNFNFADFLVDTINKKIIITNECKVFVSFIAKETINKNALGWYSYNETTPPLKTSEITRTVIFPNVSTINEGGDLETGYTIQLGENTFPAGTVIGFFLVIDGWRNGVINYDKPVFYTNSELNISGRKQYLLIKEPNCNSIVLCFEDASLASASHTDYNDVIVAVNDNIEGYESTSFQLGE